MEDKELVWLPKKLATEINEIQDDKKKDLLIIKYIDESKREIQSNLESLDDDVIRYKGLMLKAKKAFEDAKNEQLKNSYELWESFDKELPKVSEKVRVLESKIAPLTSQVKELDESLNSLKSYQLKDFLDLVVKINDLVQNKNTREIIELILKRKEKGE